MTACARSGCDGIVEADGYCNVCGLAPVGGSKRVVAEAGAAGSIGQRPASGAPAGVGPCERPGCDGIVEADGYCNVCGLAPVGGSKRVAGRPRSPPRRWFLLS